MRPGLRAALLAAALVGGLITVVPGASGASGADPVEQGPTYPSALSPADIAKLSANPTDHVLVLLANQHPERSGTGGTYAARASVLATDQKPIVKELKTVHATKVHGYSFINAIAATTSNDEAVRLSANPAVAAVVPDMEVQAPPQPSAPSPAAHAAAQPSSITPKVAAGICPTNPSQPILEPEALQSMNVKFGPGVTQPAANDLADGSGVKVAVFPDGIDPNIPDFIRNGHSAIFDYQDFSGDGTAAATGGGEAFGDASSLISQGNQVYDLSQEVNPAHPLPAGCNIRIQGVSPGAEVAVMKVFGRSLGALDSVILQGLEYAVMQDHVDVLSQSLGRPQMPNPGTDPLSLFDADAVAAGVTVVTGSGDFGPSNTIVAPGTNPAVINVGATTMFRLAAQTTTAGFQLGGGGFTSNQIAGLSSGGFSDAGPRTVDVVAGGDAGWSDCSNNTAIFSDCANGYGGTQIPIEPFGGTSEATPLTAGVAALVIQAYRATHGGASPTPALVKQIIVSTAQHINSPADLQGAGMVDGLRAVQTARSIHDANGSPTAIGQGLLYSPTSIDLTATPGTTRNIPITVTNTGTTIQRLDPALRVLGTPSTLTSGQLSLNPTTDPSFIDESGFTRPYQEVTFNVPTGTDNLVARIAWLTAGLPVEEISSTLFDPSGRMVAASGPQGRAVGFNENDVHDPASGTWTLLVINDRSLPYTGSLQYTVTGANYSTVANAVSPAERIIAPGASAPFSIIVTTPSNPGDLPESVVFGTPNGDPPFASIPVSLRSTVPVHPSVTGNFAGTLTGGVGRGGTTFSQGRSLQFDVPPNMSAINVNLNVASTGNLLIAVLADPNFSPVDAQSNRVFDPNLGQFVTGQTAHLTWANPVPGRWTLALGQIGASSSLLTTVGFNGTIDFNTPPVTATGVPTSSSTKLTHGQPVTATIHVTNAGNTIGVYVIDPRLTTMGQLSLVSNQPTTNVPLPMSSPFPSFLVPPFTSRVDFAATSNVSITLLAQHEFGSPEFIGGAQSSSTVVSVVAPDIGAGNWFAGAVEVGPFSPSATNTTVSLGATGTTRTFDPAVTSSTGNVWSFDEGVTNTLNPLLLQPGQSGDITVTFTPQASPGSVVNGSLAVENFSGEAAESDLLKVINYTYTVR